MTLGGHPHFHILVHLNYMSDSISLYLSPKKKRGKKKKRLLVRYIWGKKKTESFEKRTSQAGGFKDIIKQGEKKIHKGGGGTSCSWAKVPRSSHECQCVMRGMAKIGRRTRSNAGQIGSHETKRRTGGGDVPKREKGDSGVPKRRPYLSTEA